MATIMEIFCHLGNTGSLFCYRDFIACFLMSTCLVVSILERAKGRFLKMTKSLIGVIKGNDGSLERSITAV